MWRSPHRRLVGLLAAVAAAVVFTATPSGPVDAAPAAASARGVSGCKYNIVPEQVMNCAARAVNHHHPRKARKWATRKAVRQMVKLRKHYRFGLDASCNTDLQTPYYWCQGAFYKDGHQDGMYFSRVAGTGEDLMVRRVEDSPHD